MKETYYSKFSPKVKALYDFWARETLGPDFQQSFVNSDLEPESCLRIEYNQRLRRLINE